MRIDILGVTIDNVDMEEALDCAETLMEAPEPGRVVTPNAEIVYEATKNPELRALLCDTELVLPDGAGVILASKILKTPLKEKVAGIDFGTNLMRRAANSGKRVFLLGGKPGVAEAAAERLQATIPGLQICGTHDGYFSDEESVVAEINEMQPDLLLVCLGAPKQERFMADHKNELQVGLMAGLGGSLDGFAGKVQRAPQWMIRCNLEWFYRLIKEPWRLRRQMRLPKFLFAVIKKRVSHT